MAISHTANFNLPYPSIDRTETADVPRDFKALADAVDASLLALRHDDLIGEMKLWPAAAAPANWMLCQGQLLDRTTYANLFAVIGTAYGSTTGANFRLPDLRGRVPVGVDGAAARLASDDALGNASGEEKHTLAAWETNYDYLGGGYIPVTTLNWTTYQAAADSGSGAFVPRINGSFVSGIHPPSGADPHNNMQPYQIVNYIIRYA